MNSVKHVISGVNYQDIQPKPLDSLSLKVKKVALVIFAGLAFVIVAPVLGLLALIQRYRSQDKFKETIAALEKNRYDAVCKAKEKVDTSQLSLGIKRLSSMLITQPDMQKFRSEINEALKHLDRLNDADEKFLLAVSHALVSESPGKVELEAYGKKVVGEVSGELNYSNVAEILERAIKEDATFKKDNPITALFWKFAHPEKALVSLLDHMGLTDPLSYNSYEHGNASIQVEEFKTGNITTSLSLAPTFVADGLTEASLKHLEGTDSYRIQQDLEHATGSNKGERGRVKEKKRLAKLYPDQMVYLLTPINYKKKDKTKDLATCLRDNPDDFSFPEGIDQNELIQVVEKATSGLSLQAKLVALAALAGIKTMQVKAKNKNGVTAYINQSCKQNIDRGVVVNIATLLFSGELTEERLHQIVGITLVRAGMVDDRAILKKHFKGLLELLKGVELEPIIDFINKTN